MAYMPGQTTLSPEERRAEADRILTILDELDLDTIPANQRQFLDDMFADTLQPISREQLLWLRDIKDKYL